MMPPVRRVHVERSGRGGRAVHYRDPAAGRVGRVERKPGPRCPSRTWLPAPPTPPSPPPVPDAPVCRGALVLCHWMALSGVETDLISTQSSDRLTLSVDGKDVASGVPAVYCELARRSGPASSTYLGATPATEAAVREMLTWRSEKMGEDAPLADDTLGVLDVALRSRTWAAGPRPSVADVALYSTVVDVARDLTPTQRTAWPDLCRWIDACQGVLDRGGVFASAGMAPPAADLGRLASLSLEDKDRKTAAAASSSAPAAKKGPIAAAAGGADATADPNAPPPKMGKRDKAAAKKAAKAAAKAEGGGEAEDGAVPAADGAGAAPPAEGGRAAKMNDKREKRPPPPKAPDRPVDVTMLDLRVGVIVEVDDHPEADGLYVEQIDLGEESGPRTVLSGLRKHVPIDKMRNRRVVVCTNLKPAKMRGIVSNGMVLCACVGRDGGDPADERVDPVDAPAGAAPGERVSFEGLEGNALPEINEAKKKIFAAVAADFSTLEDGTPVYRKSLRFMTSAGPCTSRLGGGTVG